MLSVGNEADGTYDFLFDTDIDTFTDASGISLSIDGGLTWQSISASGQTGPAQITVEDIFDRPICNAWKITGFSGATFVGGAIVPDQQGVIP